MAGKGYDDTAAIRAVDGILATEPGTSRRSAIIRVAGEDSLRRIEMKMAKRGLGTAGRVMLPTAGRELDPLALRLAAGEGAVVAGAGETRLWSGLNSREAILSRTVAERVPAYARASRAFALVDPLAHWMLWAAIGSGLATVVTGYTFVFLGYRSAIVPVIAILAFAAIILATGCLLARIILVEWMDSKMGPIKEEIRSRLLRYVLTDRALYVIAPERDGVSWTRTEYGTLVRAEAPTAGNVRLVGSAGEIVIADVEDRNGLISALA